jgi:hypothetical protein
VPVRQADLGGDKSRRAAMQRFADGLANDQQVPCREQ